MNTRQKTTPKMIKIALTALMLVGLVYGSLPAQPVQASTFLVNDLGDDPDAVPDGTCDISPGDGVDNCTLRAALMEANRVDDIDVITFNVVMTLNPATALPTIVYPVTIDATSTGGRVTIDGGGGTFIGLNITADNVVVRRLSLIDFAEDAIRISGGADGVILDKNYIGVAANGTTDGGNTEKGIRVSDSPNVTISDNLISGNDAGGIIISGAASDGAAIIGNIIGLNAAGDAALEAGTPAGADGIRISDVTNATIGGSTSGQRNIISGNYGYGVVITGVSSGSEISGNYIGTSAIGEDAIPNQSGGLRIASASGVSIGAVRMNLISGNASIGLFALDSSDLVIQNNIIGLDIDGDTAMPNISYGVSLSNVSTVDFSGNVVSANTGSGLRLYNGTTGVSLKDNRIGLGAFSNLDLGNTNHGILIDNSFDSTIGDTSTALGNRIAYNDGKGIYILNTVANSYGNTIIGNQIYSNGDLGIDLAPTGVTLNDAGDPDDGPNYLQNFVTFTAKQTATGVQITGELDTDITRPNYRIEFFANSTCDASGYGEGAKRVAVLPLTISANPTAIDYEIADTSIDVGEFITATVTYDEGTGGLKDTSEFSPCAVVQEPDSPGSSGVFVVNSTADSAEVGAAIGDGFCDVGGGVCTLRAAIQEANAGAAPPYTISFNIAGTAPHRIEIGSALPAITVPVLIKGKPSGYSGPPIIEVSGTGAGSVDGLVLNEPGSTIDGLSIINFGSGAGVQLNTTGSTVSNNYIGLLANGSTSAGNQVGVNINGQTGNLVRNNVISANQYGVRLVGSASQDNTIRSNFIGTDAGGTLDRGNTSDGVRLEGSSNNLIETNTISGNNSDGIEISGGGAGNRVYGNKIGVYAGGSGNLPNSGHGININTSNNNLVANTNIIRHNNLSGVYVSGGTGNLISENSIVSNALLGIQLGTGGNDNTPAPALISASNGGSYILVEGTLTGALPDTEYTMEFFSSTSGSQGENHIFTSTVITNGSGFASFTAGPPVALPDLTIITATATDPANNTSQFSNSVYVFGSAPVLTNTPTMTPTATSNISPTNTFTPTPSQTFTPAPTNTPNPTSTSSGGSGGRPTSTLAKTSTQTLTPTITGTSTLLPQFLTLTALATSNTEVPTSTPSTPTQTLVPSPTRVPTDTATPPAPPDAGEPEPTADDKGVDGTGGGGGEGGLFDDLLSGGGGFTTILWIFIGLAVLLLVVGGAMELIRWLGSRGE
jgi:CSLREA domain-containing protein